MPDDNFNDRAINWCKLGDIEYLQYAVLDIDQDRHIADVLFKLEPHRQIIPHRHKALNKSLVIQGEHRLYEPSGRLKEVRPAGTYTSTPASDEPHRECGGDRGAIVYFSIRGGGLLYELLDDDENLVGTLSFQDLVDLSEAKTAARVFA